MRLPRLLPVLAIALAALPAAARSVPAPDFESRLREAVDQGAMDEAQAAAYRFFAVVAADRLPADLRVEEGTEPALAKAGVEGASAPDRCGTLAVRAARARLEEMPPDLREEVRPYLEPTLPPVAREASRTAGKAATHLLPSWIDTANFSIQWGPDLTNEDGTAAVDLNQNGIPDVAERWASYFEASFGKEVNDLGYTDPTVDARLIPILIGNSYPNSTIDNISTGTYAFTDYNTGVSAIPYIVVNNDLSFVPPNGAGATGLAKIRGAMKITSAHELFHVFHFLYEPPVWQYQNDDWWFETSATWMEDEVYGSVNDYYQYFRGPHGWPALVESGLPVNMDDQFYVTRAYGGVIYAKYLSEHVGRGAAAIFDVWAIIRNNNRILPALDAYAKDQGFSGLPQLYLGFAAANATMDYQEGTNFGSVPIRNTDNTLTAEGGSGGGGGTTPPPAADTGGGGGGGGCFIRTLVQVAATVGLPVPSYLGATYLLKVGGTGGGIEVDLAGAPAVTWGLVGLVDRAAGYGLALGAVAGAGSTSFSTARLAAGDSLFAVPCYLDAAAASTGYTTTETAVNVADTLAPDPVGQPTVTPLAGGFSAAWTQGADDTAVAGYVLRWTRGTSTGYRTLFGPVRAAQVGGLSVGTYQVAVFAYDTAGNADPTGATAVSLTVSQSAADTPTPPATIDAQSP